LSPLPSERFDTPTALPGWRIREVVAHLITSDRATVTGGILPVVFSSTDKLERWNDRQVTKWADRPVRDLLLGLERWGRRFVAVARIAPERLYRLNLPTMYGRGPAGLLLWARPFDEWVHRQDIRRALALPDEEVDVEVPAEFVLTAAVTITLPQLEEGGRVAVSLTGASLPRWVYDPGARTGGPDDGPADASVELPAPAFVMAASGRDPFEELRARGATKIEGDLDLADRFLAKLRIV
jgi:uncharacterized protein (TIGR03083 family)